jgi:hypothetical protein
MKKIYITILFVTITIQVQSQIDSSLRDYFPLDVGNYWEYRDNLFNRVPAK